MIYNLDDKPKPINQDEEKDLHEDGTVNPQFIENFIIGKVKPEYKSQDEQKKSKTHKKTASKSTSSSVPPSTPFSDEDFDYKKQILKGAINVSNRINTEMINEEKSKKHMRIALLIVLIFLMVLSVGFVSWLIIAKGFKWIEISDKIIFGYLTYIIADIFAIFKVMTKYISENNLLNTFGSVTQKLLDFLLNEDKKSK